MSVESPDGAVTALDITPDNARNVAGRENLFDSDYQWSAAGAEDWEGQCADLQGRGLLAVITSPDGETVLESCTGGDVVHWVREGRDGCARAVNPGEDREPYAHKFGWRLVGIAEDALRDAMLSVPSVDGAETDYGEIAGQLAEQAAAYVRDLPDWVRWKPTDIRAGGIGVFDAYRGEPENFCCGMGFRLLVESRGLDGMPRNGWEAGAGLREPDGEGDYAWGLEVLIRRDGDWACADWGTGGLFAEVPMGSWDEAALEQLLDAFFLTEGNTHDWRLPDRILGRSPEELAALPALLAGRSEAERRALAAVLGDRCRWYGANGYPENWVSPPELRAALGPYGAYLDA